MEHFKLKLDRTSIEHSRPSINVRPPIPSTNCVTNETISQSANSESFRAKMRDTPTCFPMLTVLYLVANCLYFHAKWRKARHIDARTVDWFCFETGLGKPMLTPNDPNSLKIPQMSILHYDDAIMGAIASQITSLMVVYSIVYSDADQRKHQSSASLAFVWGIHWDRWIPRTKGQLRGKCFHLMTSSWSIPNCEWQCPVKSAPECENMSIHV